MKPPLSLGYYLQRIQQRTAFETLPQAHVYEMLQRASDGTTAMNVNGSVSAVNFDYKVPSGTVYKKFMLSRIDFVIVDGAIRWGQFGGIATLTNGLLVQILDDADVVLQHFATDVHPIVNNEDFGGLAGADNVIILAAGDDALPVRFSIFKSGNPMALLPNWRVRVVVQDNLTGLTHFDAMVQGVLKLVA